MYDPVTFHREKEAVEEAPQTRAWRGVSVRHMAAVDDNNGLMGVMGQLGLSDRTLHKSNTAELLDPKI